ncbi:hypothetical protein G5C33_15795 [Sphingosinithalassobacter tenebrarum]|uniref:Uncharacterized protein n=2 Tax=Stakelama tenebrarum TaxID=2711215 RepID=A0A6G6Y086_9SPHN|nr:hypothetical protein G5C33_15795 [Sphingosinithalassobacter tenebrarum]
MARTPASQRKNLARADSAKMIDNLSLGLSHGLMILAAWILLRRPDLDVEDTARDGAKEAAEKRRRLLRKGRFRA